MCLTQLVILNIVITMPYRSCIFKPGEIYHIFNRSIAGFTIFSGVTYYRRFYELTDYYQFVKPELRFSLYLELPHKARLNYISQLKSTHHRLVEILAFSFMPNHFHFLLKEIQVGGISEFIKRLQNSYAKYLNARVKRTGAVFQSMFKGIHIESDELLLHVLRYIHLNPITGLAIREFNELGAYPWTSYPDYTDQRNNISFVNTSVIKGLMQYKDKLISFHEDQKDYQRMLAQLKYLCME
ncbi:hypothetical protein A2Z33_00020 [Candidatus Gottesmanbacteria bacterium RBG_16_52_11]|uniref:Transposase IS200-like domain-containing protein n=1 Tax=Candidatus Gottesmanbacteria bacterium RBG_16_52_11 TaxID=1798374 RepID=A0A1F5YNM1_9BACT|nr:MAG: hypothetical protein A2Z33_00020 [Candidatus Gottesmanbacteria bacterium RBG_16_52_11]